MSKQYQFSALDQDYCQKHAVKIMRLLNK